MNPLKDLIHSIREALYNYAVDVSDERAVQAFSVADLLSKELEEYKKALHPRLSKIVSICGTVDSKGHKHYAVGGAVLKHQLRVGKEPNEGAIMELLKENNIRVEEAFDRVSVLAYNPSKVANLVERGLLDQEQIDRLRSRSYALIVEKSEHVVSAFKDMPEGNKARREST